LSSLVTPMVISAEAFRPETQEAVRREKLRVLWRERQITPEKLKARGVAIEERDQREYSRRRGTHRAMKATEESGSAEDLFLEGSDTDGCVKSYNWFQDEAVAYPASNIDDVLSGADAILMMDHEDDKEGAAAAVDVTTSRSRYAEKLEKDFERLKDRRGTASVYWVDTLYEEPGLNFEKPREGKIDCLNTSVYIPPELAKTYTDPGTPGAWADNVMKRLGPFVVRQMQAELEAMALDLTGARDASLAFREQADPSGLPARAELLDALEAPKKHVYPAQRSAVALLRKILPVVWNAADALGDMDQELEKQLPAFAKTFVPVPGALEEAA
jgi:hypothetical protein